MLHVHLYVFQITHEEKQYSTYERTNYHDTIKRSEDLHMVWTASVMWYVRRTYNQNIAKLLIHSNTNHSNEIYSIYFQHTFIRNYNR